MSARPLTERAIAMLGAFPAHEFYRAALDARLAWSQRAHSAEAGTDKGARHFRNRSAGQYLRGYHYNRRVRPAKPQVTP